MTIIDPEMLWRQFGAAIDMLDSVLRDCPDKLWEKPLWGDTADQWIAAGFSAFWYLGFHALFWLDLYLTGSEQGFAAPEPFTLVEIEAGEVQPRTYPRDELLTYADYCRRKCQETVLSMTDEQAARACTFPWGALPYAELQLYNLRHVMEHGAQLRMFPGQQAGKEARWVARAKQHVRVKPEMKGIFDFRLQIEDVKSFPTKGTSPQGRFAGITTKRSCVIAGGKAVHQPESGLR